MTEALEAALARLEADAFRLALLAADMTPTELAEAEAVLEQADISLRFLLIAEAESDPG